MKGQIQTDLGQIMIDEEVIAKYAGINALECFGIVGMASVNMKDGLVKLLKRDNICKGVHVKMNDNRIQIDFHIIVVYGVSIATVTENLIQSVKYRVETFTNMTVEKINVFVEGVRIVD
ncbi:MAG: Asp23/Gls24 family envelope stress response protein [Eubacterium sp.]|nr:Asp23/Gls24 family envelope stress response protein [Eubacterium sp.]